MSRAHKRERASAPMTADEELTPKAIKKIDTLNRQSGISLHAPLTSLTVGSSMVFGAGLNISRAGELLQESGQLTILGLGAAAIAAAAVHYTLPSLYDNYRIKRTADGQQRIREAAGEPVDAFTIGSGKHRETALRWYGADHAEAHEAETAQRFWRLTQFAQDHGVAKIALDADWAASVLDPGAEYDSEHPHATLLGRYGTISAGSTFMSAQHKPLLTVRDLSAARNVLLASTEQAAKLAERLVGRFDTLHELVQRLDDSTVQRAYERYSEDTAQGHEQFLQLLHGRLERRLNADTLPHRQRGDYPSYQQHILYPYLSVSGQTLHRQLTSASGEQTEYSQTDLLTYFGATTAEEFAEALLEPDETTTTDRAALLAAAYLSVRQKASKEQPVIDIPARDAPPTMYQRMVAHPPPFFDLSGKKTDELNLSGPGYRRSRRLLSAVALTSALSVGLGWGVSSLDLSSEPDGAPDFEQSIAFISDAPQGNAARWAIESLDGTPTSGYWSSQIYDSAFVSGREGIGFRKFTSDTSINMPPPPVQIPGQHLTLEELDAQSSLVVYTPHVATDLPMRLPVRENMTISGVRVTDADNPDNVYTPREMNGNMQDDDLYTLRLNSEELKDAGITTPELRYWLSPASTATDYYTVPLSFYDAESYENIIWSPEVGEVQDSIKEALGLTADTTTTEVQAALSSKEYSRTPLHDAGIERLVDLSHATSTWDAYRSAGETIARLDALNCNLAATAMALVTNNNYVVGYRNDGDEWLTTGEEHAWTIDENNNIVDATPPGAGDDLRAPSGFTSKTDPFALLALGGSVVGGTLAAVGGWSAWRNRRAIADKLRGVRHKHQLARTLRHPGTPEALSVLEQAAWDDPSQPSSPVRTERIPQRLRQFADATPETEAVRQVLADPNISPRVKRAVKLIVKAPQA